MCAACCCTSVVPVGFSSMILQSWFRFPSVFSTFSIAGRMTSLKRRSTLRENSVSFVLIASWRLAASDLFRSNSSMAVSSAVGVSPIRHPDVVEYLRQAGVVEVNRCVEHRGMPGLQVVCDDACLGVPDPRRREQGLPAVDALDGVDHPQALRTGGTGAGAMSS